VTYVQSPGDTSTVRVQMLQSIADQVGYLFENIASEKDYYRNAMHSWQYHWGSNVNRGSNGILMLKAAQFGATSSYTPAQCRAYALDSLHFYHGQNPLNMVYLSNMAQFGGEHSSFMFYHAWFGAPLDPNSKPYFVGKPPSVDEPLYPYFKGTDNLGANDNKFSTYGPAPGFVPGGPNKDYSGEVIPPKGASFYNGFYRDWCEAYDDPSKSKTWEITENSISYQGPYVALGGYFMPLPLSSTEAKFLFARRK